MDLGSSDGVPGCYQKEYSLVRLAKLEPGSALGMNNSQRITGQKNKNKINKQAHRLDC